MASEGIILKSLSRVGNVHTARDIHILHKHHFSVSSLPLCSDVWAARIEFNLRHHLSWVFVCFAFLITARIIQIHSLEMFRVATMAAAIAREQSKLRFNLPDNRNRQKKKPNANYFRKHRSFKLRDRRQWKGREGEWRRGRVATRRPLFACFFYGEIVFVCIICRVIQRRNISSSYRSPVSTIAHLTRDRAANILYSNCATSAGSFVATGRKPRHMDLAICRMIISHHSALRLGENEQYASQSEHFERRQKADMPSF